MEIISIIVPVFNVDKYLEKCVKSILNQTYKKIELILVDDGSSDGSELLCDQFVNSDKRTRVIHILNGGVSNARNIGIDLAQGKYITFVDSDDYIEPDFIENMYKHMEKNGCDLVASNSYYITKGIKTYIVPTSYQGLYYESDIYMIIKNIIDYQDKKKIFSSSVYSKLFLKQIFNKNNIKFKTNVKMAEDTLFVVEYLLFCRNVYCSDNPGYYYVQHQNSSTTKRIDIEHKWENYKIYIEELKNIIKHSQYKTLLPAAQSTYLTSMNTTIRYAFNKDYKSFFRNRFKLFKILSDEDFRNILKNINFTTLNMLKKKRYIIQKYYLFDIIALIEIFKNLVRPLLKR